MEELGLAASLAKGADRDNTLLEYFKNSPKLDMTNNEVSNTLNKEAAFKRFVKHDPGLADASLQLLAMAQGPKAFSYLIPELTTTARVSNAIREKSASRLAGIPRKKDIDQFFTDTASRDKVLWTATGNGVKAGAIADREYE